MKKVTRYIDDCGFEHVLEPIEDSIVVTDTNDNIIVKYIAIDEYYDCSDLINTDDSMFIVAYHRDFYIEKKDIVTKDDIIEIIEKGKSKLLKKYWVFPLYAMIHGIVVLSMKSYFDCDPTGWDTSLVGAIFVSKEYWKTDRDAIEVANSYLKEINCVLSGDVYCVVTEKFDYNKKLIDYDIVGGIVGYDNALMEVKNG